VHQVFAAGIRNFRFRRAIVGEKLVHWDKLKALCMNVTLNDNEDDALVWTLSSSGKFSVKSFYLAMKSCVMVPYKFMWRVKLPPRISLVSAKEKHFNKRCVVEERG
jgi:hypothetical protein